jgi:hypothetical protein
VLKDSPASHLESVLCKNPDLSASVLPDGRWMLYNRVENTFVVLNATAGVFWEFCDGKTSVSEIVAEMQTLYPDVDSATVTKEIERTIPTLIEQGLLVHGS